MLSTKEAIPVAVVLVVEDEVLIRMDVVDQLSSRGHTLLEASNARDALQILQDSEHVDVVFTDVDMPGDLDGLMLVHEVASKWPLISLIITSGKTSIGPERLPKNARFYSKPYMSDAIHHAIMEMLPAANRAR